MTPIDDAIADIRQRVADLNKQVDTYQAEGLPFFFSADPADPGVGLQVPTGRLTTF